MKVVAEECGTITASLPFVFSILDALATNVPNGKDEQWRALSLAVLPPRVSSTKKGGFDTIKSYLHAIMLSVAVFVPGVVVASVSGCGAEKSLMLIVTLFPILASAAFSIACLTDALSMSMPSMMAFLYL